MKRGLRGVPAGLRVAAAVAASVALTAGCGSRGNGEASASGSVAGDTAPAARPGGSPGQAVRTTTIRVADHAVTVEIADTPELRERGLMHRDSLPPEHGMLFVYPRPRVLSFWMRNTRIPLDIAFLDGDGRILDIQRMEPFTDDLHESPAPALYALEMAAGWFAEHGVEPGDRVRL